MASLSEQSKDTAGDLLSIMNSKPSASDVGPDSSSYDLLMAIFKILVKKEEFKLRYDDKIDDDNDQRHFERQKRHNELLIALGAKPGVHIPRKEEETINTSKIDYKKYLKKHKIKEPKLKTPKKTSSGDSGSFGLGDIAATGAKIAGLGLIGAGLFAGSKSALGAIIGKGESFGGDPTAYNVKVGDGYAAKRGSGDLGKPITQMTVGEIRELQNQRKVFAVGKWQMIPSTLQSAIDAGKVGLGEMFDEATQDKLLDFLIAKRPLAQRYLNGDPTVSRDDAIADLAKEWAALGVPYPMQGAKRWVQTGESYYSGVGGNKASISPDLIGEALDRDRDSLLANKLKNFENLDNVSMNLDQLSRENIQSNELLTASAQQSNIVNNYNVGVKEQSEQKESRKEDDRPIFERKSVVR